jgi:predicted sulfurtransferase
LALFKAERMEEAVHLTMHEDRLEGYTTAKLKNLKNEKLRFVYEITGDVTRFTDGKPNSKDPWTKEVWVYDYRTNIHHTLKKNPLKLDDLQDFIECYNLKNWHKRKETYSESNSEGRFRKFTYDEIIAGD